MVFSSVTFLYYFLPVVLLLYALTPKRYKNITLLISSIFFYAWGEPRYVLFMLISTLCGYICARFIEKAEKKSIKRVWLTVSVCICLGMLVYFKYADFFIENFARVFNLSPKLLGVALPIGISFYTFQILSYTVDVYRGVPAQRSFIDLATYISMFPQLIAGPIVRYTDISDSLAHREHSFDKVYQGILLFAVGLGKKVLIANTLGEICNAYVAGESAVFAWVYAFAFALQIYFDFSGYSDMARGLGKFFGFEFMINFNYPFISKTVTEFWRRWHISLGTWFRDYVYIPLGGNRKGIARHIFNICVVWLLTGFWHGAEWSFILWGGYFAVFLIIEKLWLYKALDKSKVLGHIYVILTVAVSFVIFSGSSLGLIGEMFGKGVPALTGITLQVLRKYAGILLIALIGATPIPKKVFSRFKDNAILCGAFAVIIILISTAFIVDGSFNPFLYFRF